MISLQIDGHLLGLTSFGAVSSSLYIADVTHYTPDRLWYSMNTTVIWMNTLSDDYNMGRPHKPLSHINNSRAAEKSFIFMMAFFANLLFIVAVKISTRKYRTSIIVIPSLALHPQSFSLNLTVTTLHAPINNDSNSIRLKQDLPPCAPPVNVSALLLFSDLPPQVLFPGP